MCYCDVNSEIVFKYFVLIGLMNFIQGSYAACDCKKDADCASLHCPPNAYAVCMLCTCSCLEGESWRNQLTFGAKKPTNNVVGQKQQQQQLQVKT